jgi:hypothetical protein
MVDYSGFRGIVDLKRLVIDQRVVKNLGDFNILLCNFPCVVNAQVSRLFETMKETIWSTIMIVMLSL